MLSSTSRTELDPRFRRRVHLVIFGVSAVFFTLICWIWVLQVFQGERFTYLSENNRIRIKKIPGIRGMVFDRKDRLLVDSRPSFDLSFVPEDAEAPERTMRHLARLLRWDERELLRILEEHKTRQPFREIVLDRDIDWGSVVAVETHQTDLPGVTLRILPKRSYLTSAMTAHLLGYLGEISPAQLRVQEENGYSTGDEIGKFGLEKKWEEDLRGRSGGQQVEVDVFGREVRVLQRVKAVPGHSAFLTIDRDLQQTAYEVLAGKEGAIVVLDVNSGAILALVSTPSFDPNIFARGISTEEWRALIRDEAHPLHNRAIQGQYPPGSTFKIVLAIAGLEEGVIEADTTVTCHGSMAFGKRLFRDWKKGGHGTVDLHKAMVESCDVYFYQLGKQLGVDRIARYARRLGLGERTGIELDGEKAGIIPDTEWKRKRFNQPWFPGETPSVAIGQGYVNVTPLQMAVLVATVANGGTLYRPWFVRRVESLDGRVIREYRPDKVRSVGLSEESLAIVRKALRDAVNARRGTGKRARSELVEVAGKTGTAQVAEMRGATIKSEELPYHIRDHAWFVAYAPAEESEIAVVVLVEHGGHGGSGAAPLAKQVIDRYFSLTDRRVAFSPERSDSGETRAN